MGVEKTEEEEEEEFNCFIVCVVYEWTRCYCRGSHSVSMSVRVDVCRAVWLVARESVTVLLRGVEGETQSESDLNRIAQQTTQ